MTDWGIENETHIGRVVHEAGLPSPAVFDMVNVDGRRGVVFQQIIGKSMLRHADVEPWNIQHYARQMARFQFKMHQCTAEQLFSQFPCVLPCCIM